MAGSSVHLAALEVRHKLLRFAAGQLQCEVSELDDSGGWVFLRAAPEKRVGLAAAAQQLNGIAAIPVRPGLEGGLEATAYHQSPRSVYSSGTTVIEVEVDPDTGHASLERCVFVHDCA